MNNQEHEKSKIFIIVEIIEYVPNSVVIKTIIKKTTGNVSAVSFDSGETLTEKVSPFDTFIQVIDGRAEIVIDDMITAVLFCERDFFLGMVVISGALTEQQQKELKRTLLKAAMELMGDKNQMLVD